MPSACTAPRGGGVSEREGAMNRIDVIEGTLARRSAASAAISPAHRNVRRRALLRAGLHLHHRAAAGGVRRGDRRHPAPEDVDWERERHQERAARVKAVLTAAGLPVMRSPTHIVPVMVGDPEKCKAASDRLLAEHGIYIQPINYPTVPKGTERLRIAPSPYHDDALIDALAEALVEVWERSSCRSGGRALAAE